MSMSTKSVSAFVPAEVVAWCLVAACAGVAGGQEEPPAPAGDPPRPQPEAAANPAPEGDIRFQFEGIPYADAVKRFAQMAGKPIIGDIGIEGTLTFSDPEPYTYEEALDTFNLILSMKGVALLEADRYLRVASRDQLPQLPVKIFRGLDGTGDARPGEIVTVVLPLTYLEPVETAQAASKMLSGAGSISPLVKGQGLVITDRLDSIQRIKKLLVEADVETTRGRVMKTHRVISASGAVLAEMIDKTFGAATAPRKSIFANNAWQTAPPNPEDYVATSFDQPTGTLVLFGPPENVELAEELIARFEDLGSSAGELRIFYPRFMAATELATMIRVAVPGVAPAGEAPGAGSNRARLLVDARSNRLIVAAPVPESIGRIESFIDTVDTDPERRVSRGRTPSYRLTVTRIFRVQHGDPEALANTMREATTTRDEDGQTRQNLSVHVDPVTRTIVVSGAPGSVQTAERIHQELDIEPPAAEPRLTHVFQMADAAQVERLVRLVEPLYQAQVSGDRRLEPADARIVADAETRSLIVTGRQAHVDVIRALVEQLGTPGTAAASRELAVIDLEHSGVEETLAALRGLIDERTSRRDAAWTPAPAVIPDAARNRLLVNGTATQLEEIRRIVGELDRAPATARREMRVLPTGSRQPAQLTPLVERLLGEARPGSPRPTLIPDDTARRIVVLATPEDQDRIATIVSELLAGDRPAAERASQTIELRESRAAELVSLVEQLYRAQMAGQEEPAGGPATFLAGRDGRSLIVTGTTEQLARIEKIVAQLDGTSRETVTRETRTLALGDGSRASEIVPLVEQLYRAQVAGREEPAGGPATFLAGRDGRSLIVTGTAEQLARIEKIIEQLEGTSRETVARETRSLLLDGDSRASELLPLVEQLYAAQLEGRDVPPGGRATVVADPDDSRLIITGTVAEIDRVDAIVRELARGSVARPREETRVFRLRVARADDVLGVVRGALNTDPSRPVLRLSADAASNSIVVSGPAETVAAAGRVISELDALPDRQPRELRILPLRAGTPSQLAPLVRQVFEERMRELRGPAYRPQASIVADDATRRIVVVAPEDEMRELGPILEELQHAPVKTEDTRVFKLEKADAGQLAEALSKSMDPLDDEGKPTGRVRIAADATTNSIIVSGPVADLEAIESFIEDLDESTPDRSVVLRVVELSRERGSEIAAAVTSALPRREGATPVTVTADPSGRRVVVRAPESEIAEIEELIAALDGKPPIGAPRELELIEPLERPAVELAPLVTQAYESRTRGRLDAGASITVDQASNRLIVLAPPAEVAIVREIVAKLDVAQSAAPRETRFFPVADAAGLDRLQSLARQLYEEQLRGEPASLGPPDAVFVPDAANRRLIVTGRVEHLDRIATIIAGLEGDERPLAGHETRVFALADSAEVERLSALLQTVYAAETASLTGPRERRATIQADAPGRRIIAVGPAEELDRVASLLEKLRGQQSVPERQTMPLEVAGDAQSMLALVRQVYESQLAGRPQPEGGPATLLADPTSRRILVTGTPDEIARVATVLRQLESESSGARRRDTRAIELHGARASELLPLVEQIYRAQIDGRDPDGGAARLTAGLEGDRLIVTGPTAEIERVEELVRKLDPEGSRPASDSTRVVRLTTAIASEIEGILAKVINTDPERPRVRILVDERSNSLVLRGPSDALEAASGIVDQLDTDASRQPRELRVFKLRSGSASVLAPRVTETLVESMRQVRGPTYRTLARIVPDDSASRLIVTAPRDELDVVGEIVDRLNETAPQEQDVRVFQLTRAPAARVAEAIAKVMNPRDERGEVIERVRVSPDDSTNVVVVAGRTADVEAVQSIVTELDVEPGRTERALRVIELEHRRADELAPLVARTREERARGREDAGRQPSITADPTANRLIVIATEADFESVREIVDTLDVAPKAVERETRIFELTDAAEVERLLPIVQQLYREEGVSRRTGGAADAVFIADSANRRFIVTGRRSHLERIAAILERVRSPANRLPRETRVLALGSAEELSRVVPLLEQLYRVRVEDRPELGPADAEFVRDATTGRCLVIARPDHLALIDEIAATLDAGAAPEAVDTRVYELRTGSATELAETVSRLYRERARGRPGARTERVLVLPDSTANRLIINAPRSELTAIEAIVSMLDAASTQTDDTRVLRLENADAQQVSTILSNALVRRTASGAVPRVSVGADPKTNTIVVSGEPRDLQAAAVIVEQLDRAEDARPRVLRAFDVGAADVTQLAGTVEQVYQSQVKGAPGSGAADALVVGDVTGNRLVVTATAEHMALIEKIIGELDGGRSADARELRVVALENASAASISSIVSQLFARDVGAIGAGRRLVISASPDDRTVVVDGPRIVLERVEQLVRTLDAERGGAAVLRTVKLDRARASALATAIRDALRDRGQRDTARQVTVTPEPNSNSLLIHGPEEAVREVLELIGELDAEASGGDFEMRIFRVENGKVQEVSRTLQVLLERLIETRTDPAARPPLTVVGDERTRSIFVSTTPPFFAVVERLLESLDRAPEKSERDVRNIALENAEAYRVASQVEAMFAGRPADDRPSVETDPFTNSLTIVARGADIRIIEDLVSKLDAAARESEVEVRVLPLPRMSAERMAQLIQRVYSRMAGTRVEIRETLPERTPRKESSPPERGPPSESAPPEKTGKEGEADEPPGPAHHSGVVYGQNQEAPGEQPREAAEPARPREAENAGADETDAEAVGPPPVVIAVEKETNSLLLSGPRRELEAIEELIRQLSFGYVEGEMEFRIFRIERADPLAVARTLDGLFNVKVPEGVDAQGNPILPPPTIAAVTDRRARSIIVRARPQDFIAIEQVVRQLDAPELRPVLEFRTFPLQHVTPARVLPAVEQLLAQLRESRPGDPITVTADARNRALIVAAPVESFDSVREILDILDTPPAFLQTEVAIIPLKKASAPQLVGVLRAMLQPDASGTVTPEALALQEQVRLLQVRGANGLPVRLDLTQPIRVLADPVQPGATGGNRLIVASTPDNLRALESVIAMMDTVPVVEGITVRLVRLERADATTVAATLTEIFLQGQRLGLSPGGQGEPEGESGRALVNPLNVSTDRRTNTLVISGQPATVALALGVIQDLDAESDDLVTEVRLFRLRHASASRLAPILQAVFAESTPVPGAEGLSTQVTRLRTLIPDGGAQSTELAKARLALTIQPDETTNTLVVAARADVMPLIADVISTMDIPAASGLGSVRIFPLDHANATALQTVITNLYSGPNATLIRLEDRATVTVDTRTNALVVAGNETAFAFVTSLVFQLDRPGGPAVEHTVIPLEHNEASIVGPALQQFFTARLQATTPSGQTPSPADIVAIGIDSLTNSLIVSANAANLEVLRDLLARIDAEPTIEGSRLRIFLLEHADVQRAATMLRSLVQQGLYRPGLATAGALGTARERLAIVIDPRSNALIVSASPENLAVIEEVVAQIDDETYAGAGGIQLYTLEHASALRLALVLQQFFAARRAGEAVVGDPEGLVPVNVTADGRTNTLIVSASRETFALIERMIERLDRAEIHADASFRIFQLRRESATKLRDTLLRLFQNRPRREGDAAPQPITIVADSFANALIVTALPEDLDVVASLIERLDGELAEGESGVEVIPLARGNARSVAATIQSLYSADATVTANPVTLTVDDRMNALVVSAGEADMARIRELVEKLDSGQVGRVSEIRVFPLKHARATELARILTEAIAGDAPPGQVTASAVRQTLLKFAARGEGEESRIVSALREDLLITPDARTNSLVVVGPVESLSLIERIIAELDTASPQLAQIKVFTLINADARKMVDILSDLFRLRRVGFDGGAFGAPGGSAFPGGQQDAQAVRYRLVDGAASGEQTGDEEQTPATDITIGTAEQASLVVTVDPRTNSLIVGGTEHYVSLAGEIIHELDASPARERRTQVYRLRNAQAADIQNALNTFLRQSREGFVQPVGGAVQGAAGEAVGTSVEQQLEENVAIVGEPKSNTLLLSASPRYFEELSLLIEELDRPQPQVLIQALLAEVTLDDTTELGVEWGYIDDAIAGQMLEVASDFGLADAISRFGGLSASVTGGDITMLLRALRSDGRLEVLSRPQILAADNVQAEINIGESVPQVTGSQTTELGNINNTIEYRDVGIILRVTPRISPDGFVRLEVEPELSSRSSSSVNLGGGGEAPIFNERRARTTISVQDGHTIIIGGLISTSDDVRDAKVPILGDIPLLGAAFRSRTVVKRRTELLIILTPYIIGTSEDADRATQENIRKSGIQETRGDRMQKALLEELNRPGVEKEGNAPAEPSPEAGEKSDQ